MLITVHSTMLVLCDDCRAASDPSLSDGSRTRREQIEYECCTPPEGQLFAV
jgi:hypothetical protein